jgi:RNA polymerase sigma factor (sigma-70 family)
LFRQSRRRYRRGVSEDLDSWFKREIVVHEAALMHFIRRHWRRGAGEILDLRQETYVRVYAAAMISRPAVPRAFLFTTARNLMADWVRRQRVVTIDTVGDLELLLVMRDELTPERRAAARQELRVLAQALDALPPRCRETVWLRRVERLSQKEVATRLGVAQKTVEWQLQKGMKRLADALFGKETHDAALSEADNDESESRHGKQQAD